MYFFKQVCLLLFCYGGKAELTHKPISKYPFFIQKATIKDNFHKQLGLLCG